MEACETSVFLNFFEQKNWKKETTIKAREKACTNFKNVKVFAINL
jgi:hypothetical protein